MSDVALLALADQFSAALDDAISAADKFYRHIKDNQDEYDGNPPIPHTMLVDIYVKSNMLRVGDE